MLNRKLENNKPTTMVLTFQFNGTTYSAQLDDKLVQEYKQVVTDFMRFHSPAMDRQRREAHNKVSKPVLQLLLGILPEEDEKKLFEEARAVVANFFANSLTGRSRVREVKDSNLYI